MEPLAFCSELDQKRLWLLIWDIMFFHVFFQLFHFFSQNKGQLFSFKSVEQRSFVSMTSLVRSPGVFASRRTRHRCGHGVVAEVGGEQYVLELQFVDKSPVVENNDFNGTLLWLEPFKEKVNDAFVRKEGCRYPASAVWSLQIEGATEFTVNQIGRRVVVDEIQAVADAGRHGRTATHLAMARRLPKRWTC